MVSGSASTPTSPAGLTSLPAGVRNLAKAFTRAIPAVNSSDPAWHRLPFGPAGTLRLTIAVGADHRLAEVEVLGQPPPHMRRLQKRTLLALKMGRFAVDLTESGAGQQTLLVEAFLAARPPAPDYDFEERQPRVTALSFEAPTPERPGEARVEFASGRTLRVKVTIEPD
jgi:hypothetical protein